VIFHEVGHAVAPTITDDFSAFLDPEFEQEPDNEQEPDDDSRLDVMARNIRFVECANRWITELLSDAIAVALAGPAYVAAFARLLSGFFALETATATHPPTALRIRLMCKQLGSSTVLGGYEPRTIDLIQSWQSTCDALHEAKSYAPDEGQDDLEPLLGPLVRTAEKVHSALVDAARDRVGDHAYREGFGKQDLVLAEMLVQLGIPPIERQDWGEPLTHGSPLSPARIFSVCWSAYSLDTSPPDVRARRYGRALLESLDASEALRRWIQTK